VVEEVVIQVSEAQELLARVEMAEMVIQESVAHHLVVVAAVI
jgi:hypothetical protein